MIVFFSVPRVALFVVVNNPDNNTKESSQTETGLRPVNCTRSRQDHQTAESKCTFSNSSHNLCKHLLNQVQSTKAIHTQYKTKHTCTHKHQVHIFGSVNPFNIDLVYIYKIRTYWYRLSHRKKYSKRMDRNSTESSSIIRRILFANVTAIIMAESCACHQLMLSL